MASRSISAIANEPADDESTPTCALFREPGPLDRAHTSVDRSSALQHANWLSFGPLAEERALTVPLKNLNTREFVELAIAADGDVEGSARAAVETFFRCKRTGKTHRMSQGVLKVLGAIAVQFPGHAIEVVSGFRTYPNGVRDSKHFEGRAIDLRVVGVKTTKVRDFVWKHFADVGVGYYLHENFVHIDYRPEEKDTAWTVIDEGTPYALNPAWALRIRSPLDAPAPLAMAVLASDHPKQL
jgi:uncharacterized protein YcbK (DUF882 family)